MGFLLLAYFTDIARYNFFGEITNEVHVSLLEFYIIVATLQAANSMATAQVMGVDVTEWAAFFLRSSTLFFRLGKKEGLDEEGWEEGWLLGDEEGWLLGDALGTAEGTAEGVELGDALGTAEGIELGAALGTGEALGAALGTGEALGAGVALGAGDAVGVVGNGVTLGAAEGDAEGVRLGAAEGDALGTTVGPAVGGLSN
jgi:hypothetical protein